MSENEQSGGERRRRRREQARRALEAEQAREPLTRRELRAREEALQSGALRLDETGEFQVVRRFSAEPDDDQPVTGTIGMTRRELRALREQQAAAAAAEAVDEASAREADGAAEAPVAQPDAEHSSPASATDLAAVEPGEPAPEAAEPASGVVRESVSSRVVEPVELPEQASESPAEPVDEPPSPAAPATPARGLTTGSFPSVRPVVRPPAGVGASRSLDETGTGLTPVIRSSAPDDVEVSAGSWTAELPAVDVTDAATTASLPKADLSSEAAEPEVEPVEPEVEPAEPAAESDMAVEAPASEAPAEEPASAPSERVADVGPLPTTRRSRRVIQGLPPAESEAELNPGPPSSIDELIAGEVEEPEPFSVRPSWAQLPPATPSAFAAVAEPEAAPSSSAHVPSNPASPIRDLSTQASSAVEHPLADLGSDERTGDDYEHEEEHRTPRWLTALMILVLIVIGVVLALLVYQLFIGDGAAGAASMMQDREWLT